MVAMTLNPPSPLRGSTFRATWRTGGWRPSLLTVVSLGLVGIACRLLPSAQAAELVDVHASAGAAIASVGLDEVAWTTGFWADRFATLRERSIPAMWEIMRGDQYKPFLQHFEIAAGDRAGDYHGAQWNDGDFYKFLEGVTAVYAATKEPALAQILDQSIAAIAKAQRADGYIHTPVLIANRNGNADAKPFSDRADFEMYNMGHLLTAACLHHRVTGRDDFLAVARKTADFLDRTFANPTPELARNSVCPSHYMGVVELYRTTGEPRYLALALRFLAMRDLVAESGAGGDDNQDRVPFLQQREAVGHAVRANYLFAGVADLLLESGDAALHAPLDACWTNLITKKMYVTGGCGALYDGASPDGSSDQSQITRIHQAYGRDYQLPNTTAHNETCAAIGSVMWNWRMFLATGDAKYVDVLELALYNSVLSGVSLSGVDYFYVNPLRQTDPLPVNLRWSRTRVPFVTSYCCPPNVLRTLAEVHGYAYAKADDAILVNLYGGSALTTTLTDPPGQGGKVRLTQSTDYPWDGAIRIEFRETPGREFALKLRIPGWAETPTVRVNGEELPLAAEPGTYITLRRNWRAGDAVVLDLPMPAVQLEANPLVEETRNQVAVKRGPLVYCLESPDLPEGVRVEEIAVPDHATFSLSKAELPLEGVSILETELVSRTAPTWKGDALYRPRPAAADRPIRTRLIPYYAWSNRGESEMSVWLPHTR
jgi:DUF1680 family protein